MPDLMDNIYCSEQIHIPPTFPYIMKLYCKAAIRTQPYDLLKWSAAYFRALANGEEPPAKERVEFPPYDSPSGITPGYIKILINQIGKDPETVISAQVLFRKWTDICLEEQLLVKLIALLGATTQINWVKFVGVCAGFISKTLTHTMILICELFTDEPEGGMATVPYALFVDLYMFLAQLECGPLSKEDLEQQEEADQAKEICEAVEKIREGLYQEPLEELGEAEENLIIGEMKSEKSAGISTSAAEMAVEEEEEHRTRFGTETRSSSRSKKKRENSGSHKFVDEQEGEEEELEKISAASLSARSSFRGSPGSLSGFSDEKDEGEKSEKKKSKEIEGEAEKDAEVRSVIEEKSFDERRRTTFREGSDAGSTLNEIRDDMASSHKRKATTSSGEPRHRSTPLMVASASHDRSTMGSTPQPMSIHTRSTLDKSDSQKREGSGMTTSYKKETSGALKDHEKDENYRRISGGEKQSVYRKYTIDVDETIASKKVGKIDLEKFESSIRAKIEAKLAEEDALMDDEEEKELKDLTTYLTSPGISLAQKFSIDNLGYKIFKKFMRQDVPGIGPYVETFQVEKVVDYMDYWSNKQNGMVMPRNIRHWMCPPLDKLPAPEP